MEGELERLLNDASRHEEEARVSADTIKRLEFDLKTSRQALKDALGEAQRQRAEGDQSRTEIEKHRDDLERVHIECAELMDRLAREQEHNENLRSQLQAHEATERRRFSYNARRPAARAGLAPSASVGTLASVDELVDSSPRTPSESSTRSGRAFGTGIRTPLSQHSSIGPDSTSMMDKDERIAFLSHFPMASRTERVIGDRIEEKRRHNYVTDGGSGPASPVLSARSGLISQRRPGAW